MNGYLRNMQGPNPAGNNLPAATVSRSKLLPGKIWETSWSPGPAVPAKTLAGTRQTRSYKSEQLWRHRMRRRTVIVSRGLYRGIPKRLLWDLYLESRAMSGFTGFLYCDIGKGQDFLYKV